MRFQPYLVLVFCLLLSACANPLAQAPAPTDQPTALNATSAAPAAAPPTAAPTTAAPPTAAPPTALPQPTAAVKPAYAQAACKFTKPPQIDVTCGYLTVPQDRSKADGKTLRLHVAVFKSKSALPAPDPVVYLEGGPGGHALENVADSFQDRFAPFLADRDFIMFDQRGTGYSEPSLDCKELVDAAYEKLDQNLSSEESTRSDLAAAHKCHDRLVGAGIDPAAYTSAANAADLNDLRIALGYDTWNLYGISYGTRLALTTMRDFPTGIRSVILDSSYPLQASLDADVPTAAARVFKVFFDGCAADAACNEHYPNLKTTFYELVDRLNKQPVTASATDPFSGKEYKVLLNGDKLITTLFQSFYVTEIIPRLPRAIVVAHAGTDYSLLARLALIFGAVEGKFVSYGMYFSVQCGEETHFETREQLVAADQAYPEQQNVFDAEASLEVCGQWGAKPADPIENQPVTSDLPTLVLSGEYDPITPPNYNQTVAKTLSRSFLFEFPGIGHGVSVADECPLNIAKAFLNKPTSAPDATCIKAMHEPAFIVPGAAAKLVPFTNTRFGIKGVAPEGWTEDAPGVYSRSSAGDVTLLQQALPATRDATLELLSKQFKLDKPPASTGSRKTDHLTWSLYELTVQGQSVDLALAEQGDTTYLVLLASDPSERSSLYDQVFLPVISAYTPTS